MNDHPVLIFLMLCMGSYVLHLWRIDYIAARDGHANRGALPGATPCAAKALWIGAAGAAIIVAMETWAESRLGLSDQQTKITVLFGVYTLLAAFIEELIFRGYLVIENRGPAIRLGAILGASLLFSAIHPFLWQWDDDGFAWTITAKGWFSTAAVFASSLWFYALRFSSFNPSRSLLPCIVAHAVKNLGVFAIKGIQGFVDGWW